MSEPPLIPSTPSDIRFVIDRLKWTLGLRYFKLAARSGRLYVRIGIATDYAHHTHEACLLGLVDDGYVTEGGPGTECRMSAPERGRTTLVPLTLTSRGGDYLDRLVHVLRDKAASSTGRVP
ncbi:hypothetical protein [Kutzneria chonburiensis]|uniref:Transcriptional regulator n=1 Tax=Kutzneria chonburiensis TaxID=1483604 RepID=A0ABV6MIB0_9PSEU|nr:hypothetical protein [Kutzneria chonburiensis]